MTKLSNSFSKFVGNYCLYSYYLSGIGDVEESAEKCFLYCKEVVDLYDLEKYFDKKDINHQRWLECLSILGSCYLDGYGTNKDFKKGFDISLKAALLGDKESILKLGEIYELGKCIFRNFKKAIEWYQEAAILEMNMLDKNL